MSEPTTEQAQRVLKWNVPVDDRPHQIGGGPVVLVDCQYGDPSNVQVWTVENGNQRPVIAQVYGTGQPAPTDAFAVGSVLVEGHTFGTLVWHVLTRPGDRT